MSAVITETRVEPTVLHFQEVLKKLTEEEFERFCYDNKDMRIELTKEGDLIVMPPTGGETGIRNFSLITQFGIWVEADGTGYGFDSSTLFTLPNGAKRSPDLSWVKKERWEALPKEERKKFSAICPDFVVELRSETDSLKTLQEKMKEYIENGTQLGWLIDPIKKKVYVYCLNVEAEELDNPETISGEPLLKGFALNMRKIWEQNKIMRRPEFTSTELLREGYELVHSMYDYELIGIFQGSPIIGVANFNREPYFYQCLFDKTKNELTTNYLLKPVDNETFKLCMEGEEIRLRWQSAFRLRQTTMDTFPALSSDKIRYEEIKAIVKTKLEKDYNSQIVAKGMFKLSDAGYFVKWDRLDQ